MEWGGDGDGEREPILPYKDRPVLQNLQDRPLSPCTIPSPFPDAAASAAPGAGLQWIPPRQKKAGRPVQLRRCPRRRRRRPAELLLGQWLLLDSLGQWAPGRTARVFQRQ